MRLFIVVMALVLLLALFHMAQHGSLLGSVIVLLLIVGLGLLQSWDEDRHGIVSWIARYGKTFTHAVHDYRVLQQTEEFLKRRALRELEQHTGFQAGSGDWEAFFRAMTDFAFMPEIQGIGNEVALYMRQLIAFHERVMTIPAPPPEMDLPPEIQVLGFPYPTYAALLKAMQDFH